MFTDIHNSRRMKHVPGQAATVDLEPTNRANGLTRDLQGRLLSCEHDTRRVTRRELDGSLTVLANSFQGRRLNRPNDVVVKSDGAIYFTDPWSSPAAPEQWDLTFAGVYRLTPDLGTLSLLIDNFVLPNGLAFSPDESVLYVNDTRRGHIRAFDVLPNGTLAKQSDRVFADLRGSEPGVPDGMKVDVAGNVYCGGAGGIWILDPQGKKLGRIVHGHPATTNIAFGGDDWKTLYFTSRTHLGSVNVKITGHPGAGGEEIAVERLARDAAPADHGLSCEGGRGMLTLYYAPGACSMAAHIVLEESGEKYQPQKVDLANGEQRTEAYLKINPQGRVPVLRLDDGEPLAENTAILPYLGKRFGLWPKEPLADAKALSLIGFFAASVHPAHAHVGRPERYAADPSAYPTIKETGLKTFHGYLKQVDDRLAGREWFADQYSVLDPYGFVFYTWGVRRELPMGELKNYTAFKDRMVKRPAVQRVMVDEKIKV